MSWFRNQIQKFAVMYGLEQPNKPQLYMGSPSATYDRLKQFKKILGDELAEVDLILEKLNGQGTTPVGTDEEVLTDIADWLGDIQVYCASEMMKFGLNNDEVLAIIMESNFSKLGEDGKAIMKDGKVQKGPNYWRPEPKLYRYITRARAGEIQVSNVPFSGFPQLQPGNAQDVNSANAIQVGGSHYKTGGEEHWDRVNRLGLDYFQAQVTKYVERCWKKNGLEDLKKARHFLDKYIEIRSSQGATAGAVSDTISKLEKERTLMPWQVGYLPHAQDSNEYWQNAGYYGDGTCLWTCRNCRAQERVTLTPPPHHCHAPQTALEPSEQQR